MWEPKPVQITVVSEIDSNYLRCTLNFCEYGTVIWMPK